MSRWWWVTLCLAGCQGCGEPGFPGDPTDTPDPVEDDTDEAEETDVPPDSEPEPPCAVPEQEPNNSAAAANVLPLEQVACGDFVDAYDGDFWAFQVRDAGWLSVDVTGLLLGSDAKLSLTLSSDNGVRVGALDSQGLPEAHLKLPVQPGAFQALVRQAVGEEGGQGAGPDYFYELRASSTKPPVSWDLTEGSNDARTAAQRLLPGGAGKQSVFGTIEGPADQDWYEVRIPAARYRLTADVIAHAEGSGGDFALQVWQGGVLVQIATVGPVGWEKDPHLVWQSLQGETLQLRVVEEGSDSGIPYWYVLSLELVEE